MNTDVNGKLIHTVVLYHKGCVDGLVAAWAASSRFGDRALYIPHQYGDPLPEAVQGRQLILVDLSLPASTILELQRTKAVTAILIIDHHKTAQPLLEIMTQVSTYNEYIDARLSLNTDGEVSLYIYFDLEHSGAVLSWMFFNEKKVFVAEEVPYFIRLVEDYDLWKLEYHDTRAINAWLRNAPGGFAYVDILYQADRDHYERILGVGSALLTYDNRIVGGIVKGYVESGRYTDFRFALVNGPHHLRNEISDALLADNAYDVCGGL